MVGVFLVLTVGQAGDLSAWYNDALDLMNQGNYEEAEDKLRKALAQAPDSSYLHEALADLYFNMDDLEASLSEYLRTLELDPENSNAAYSAGYIYQEWDMLDSARYYYRLAVKIDPSDPGIHLNLGNVLWDLEDLRGAEAEYREAIRLEPSYTKAHYNLGLLNQQEGRDSVAESEYRAVLEYDPESYDARWNLLLLYEDTERYEEAGAQLDTLLKYYPDNIDALYEMGRVYEKLGDEDEAKKAYARVIDRDPEYGEAYYRMAVLLGAASDEGDLWSGESGGLLAGEESPSFWGVGVSYDSRYYQNTSYRETKVVTDIPATEVYAWWGKYLGSDMATYITGGANFPMRLRQEEGYDSLDNYDLSWEVLRYFSHWTLDMGLRSRFYPKYYLGNSYYKYITNRLTAGAYIFFPKFETDVFMVYLPQERYLKKAFWWETDISGQMHHGEFKSEVSLWQRWDTYSDRNRTTTFEIDAASASYSLRYQKKGFSASAGAGYFWLMDRAPHDPESGPYYYFGLSYSR